MMNKVTIIGTWLALLASIAIIAAGSTPPAATNLAKEQLRESVQRFSWYSAKTDNSGGRPAGLHLYV